MDGLGPRPASALGCGPSGGPSLPLLLPPSLGEEGPMPARAQKRKYTPSHISIFVIVDTNSEEKKSRRIEPMKLVSQAGKNIN